MGGWWVVGGWVVGWLGGWLGIWVRTAKDGSSSDFGIVLIIVPTSQLRSFLHFGHSFTSAIPSLRPFLHFGHSFTSAIPSLRPFLHFGHSISQRLVVPDLASKIENGGI
jgi:hypothetical protein